MFVFACVREQFNQFVFSFGNNHVRCCTERRVLVLVEVTSSTNKHTQDVIE